MKVLAKMAFNFAIQKKRNLKEKFPKTKSTGEKCDCCNQKFQL